MNGYSFGVLAILVINFIIGGMSVDYILSWFGKNIPFLGDMTIGLFVGEFSIPIAFVGWILKSFGVF
jgi:hypothetical protein